MSGLADPALMNGLSTIGISIGVALVGSVLLAAWIGWELGLSPEGKMWAFILGFALLGGLTIAPSAHGPGWNEKVYYGVLAGFLILVYFVPTAAAAATNHPSAQAIFILNLFFGWTLIGWLAALGWAVSAPRAEPQPDYRITPFGAVPARPPAGTRRPG